MSDNVVMTHGGVGAKSEWSDGCDLAAESGLEAMVKGSVLDGVVAAARVLEDDDRYNAGTGANLRLEGVCELDASIMVDDGSYGAVACITGVRHPIDVARLVMEKTPHVMLCGEGASAFARMQGIEPYSPVTLKAMAKLEKYRERLAGSKLADLWPHAKFCGTIGAVARTADGRFGVSCSTGGTALMLRGRVGDSPICGAGVYAGSEGAICCTGTGEIVMKRLTAFRVYLALERGESLAEACKREIDGFPKGKYLGIIAIGKTEHCVVNTHDMPFSVKRRSV
jgi:L-asparaginase / beta-aspartyl-peptidase